MTDSMKKIFGYAVLTALMIILVFWLNGEYRYSQDQKEVIRGLGMPDSFDIYYFSEDNGDQRRIEKWAYHDSLQNYVFVNGVFSGVEETEDIENEFLPVPYRPGDFEHYMTWSDIKPLIHQEEYIKASHIMPGFFEDLDVELYYSKQLVAGFDKACGELLYVRALTLVADNVTIVREKTQ